MKEPGPPLVLASGSPRRADILSMLGLAHTVDPADVDETVLPGETPEAHVDRLARAKAAEVASRRPDALVLAGDTVVVVDDRILGKPADISAAADMLLTLAGRAHRVLTGLALAVPTRDGDAASPASAPRMLSRVDGADVVFRSFGRDEAETYAATGEPLDKAGAYGIQGLGAALVERMEGDYYTVVGLSVAGLLALLDEAGHRYVFPPPERPL